MTGLARLLQFARLLGHLLAGMLTILLLFRFLDREEREKRIVRWAAKLLSLAGLRARIVGRPPRIRGEGALIVANHVSWLDIQAVHGVLPARFIAKSEVRDWPMIGWMAEQTGTLFLGRGSRTEAARMNKQMAALLAAEECLALFPEGTTTDGSHVLPFYPSLLQPAIDAGAKIWPLVIRYLDRHGHPTTVPAYHGDLTLLDSLLRILRVPGMSVELHFLPPLTTAGRQRRELSKQLETAIRDALADAGRDSAPETAAHHQGDRR